MPLPVRDKHRKSHFGYLLPTRFNYPTQSLPSTTFNNEPTSLPSISLNDHCEENEIRIRIARSAKHAIQITRANFAQFQPTISPPIPKMATQDLPIHPKPQEGPSSSSSTTTTPPYKTYSLGDFTLQNQSTLPSAHLAYQTLGSPSNPAIIYPTWYSGTIATNLWLTGAGKTLDPARFYIIIPALFGNGESTSPSNWARRGSAPFPQVTFWDNVRAQHELVTKGLGVTRARCVLGWSMGAGQTFQWATQYPSFMELAVPFCGSARTSLHNQVFLEGVKAALLGARGQESAGVCAKQGGEYRPWTEEEKARGLKAL